jgi:glucoamylase
VAEGALSGDSGEVAPGWPGLEARWTSSAKSGVGTALTAASRVWFTLSHGIVNEVYYPRVDHACTRDMGLIVTCGDGFFSEEKRQCSHRIRQLEAGVPAFEYENTCDQGRYRILKRIIADPKREVLLQSVRWEALAGEREDYRLFVLLAPHLVNAGAGNTAWVDDYKGVVMLFAEGHGTALALACSRPWRLASAGFVGASDGWQELSRHGELTPWQRAENGNVALTGEIPLDTESVVLALAFGTRAEEAAQRARASLDDGFEDALEEYVAGWRQVLDTVPPLGDPGRPAAIPARSSVAVMLAHESASAPGAVVASLSIPWGSARGDNDLGGYHLVWPRDLVEIAGGLLAAGLATQARAVLNYLQSVQEADGHWPQNMWADGRPYWRGVQLDECAFPILLVDLLHRNGALDDGDLPRYSDMIERAAAFIVCNGPVTAQDRWEESPGYSPFTLAVTVCALLVAARLLEARHGADYAPCRYLRDTADAWNASIDEWTFATDTPLCARLGIKGYYVRIAPPEVSDSASPLRGFVAIKNRPPQESAQPATEIISSDALALVRFGLRAAGDPRIEDTVRAIDALTRVELAQGPLWRRYNGDGYGEHEDGGAFDGTGTGRPWPLLSGERAHYELAAGRRDEARRLLAALERSASAGGLLPEQVWDSDDIPERELIRGRPSGAAMPLVWAHAEHVKLLRSLQDGFVFDTAWDAVRRYQREWVEPGFVFWRFNHKRRSIPAGKVLRVELDAAALVRWTTDGWTTIIDTSTQDSGVGLHFADLDVAGAAPGTIVVLTILWMRGQRWEGTDYLVEVRDV